MNSEIIHVADLYDTKMDIKENSDVHVPREKQTTDKTSMDLMDE